MGMLVEGQWQPDDPTAGGNSDSFERHESPFRHWITHDGSPGPTGEGGFAAAAGRYHLYVGYACPWAHRALIYRSLKGLNPHVGVSYVHWYMGENGWSFKADDEGIVADQLFGSKYLHEVYVRSDPQHTGRVTIPVLWDKEQKCIVSNESADIIRMFDTAFDKVGATAGTTRPADQLERIDTINQRVYDTLNNGVYKSGFARSQSAYEKAVVPLFETLDWLESQLVSSRFLVGDAPTEADWRLLPTLLRFDLVYYEHFKCNLQRIVDYPALSGYTRELYQWAGVADTCHFEHAQKHYYQSHSSVNPNGIVPLGPRQDFRTPHGRGE